MDRINLGRTFVFRLPVYFCDTMILILISLILFVLIAGGGRYDITAGLRIRVHTISNPLLGLYLLILLRLLAAKRVPFFGRNAWDISRLSDRTALFWNRIATWFQDLEPTKARRIVFTIIGLFIFLSASVHDPWILIFAGRMVVIFFSALSLWLVYRIASRIFSSVPVGVLSLVFLAMSKLHTSFASTDLPRTVASFFLLLSGWVLLSEKNTYGNAALSAVLLGIGP